MNRMLIDSDSAAGPSASTAAPDMQQADAVGAGSANGAPLFGQPAITLTSGCLKDVASRSHYRMRPEGEVEEAVWPLPSDEATLVGPAPARVRSVHSKQAAIIHFANKSQRPVRALWVDFDGNEVAYSLLQPGAKRLYRTYVSHPWIVREVTSGTRMMLSGAASVAGLAEEQTVEITDPPSLAWEFGTHHCFLEGFKAATKALLLAHRRLSGASQPPSCPPAAAGSAAMELSPPCSPVRCGSPAALPAASLPRSIAAYGPAGGAACCGQPLSPLSPRRTINFAVGAPGASSSLGAGACACACAEAPAGAGDMGVMPPPSPRVAGHKRAVGAVVSVRSPRPARRLRAGPALVSSPSGGMVWGVPAVFSAGPGNAGAATCLGDLPMALVLRIVELAAPPQWQGVHMPPAGRRGVKPTMLACSPDTKTQKEEAEDQEMEEQQQQGQAQQPVAAEQQPVAPEQQQQQQQDHHHDHQQQQQQQQQQQWPGQVPPLGGPAGPAAVAALQAAAVFMADTQGAEGDGAWMMAW